MPDKMYTFICTFGQGQLGGFGHRYYVTVTAERYDIALKLMNRIWGRGWSNIYEGGEQLDLSNMQELGAYRIEGDNVDQYTIVKPKGDSHAS